MRTSFLIVILLYGLLCPLIISSAQTSTFREAQAKEAAAQRASPDWDASTTLKKRVEAGDKQALSSFANMDPVVAIPILDFYAGNRTTDPEAAAIARAALKRVRGVRNYFRGRIAELHNHVGGEFETLPQFDTLVMIGTKEAVAATATFLFDNSEFKNLDPHADYSVSSIRYQAVSALMKMELPNAPTKKPFYKANDEDIIECRVLWLAKKAEYED